MPDDSREDIHSMYLAMARDFNTANSRVFEMAEWLEARGEAAEADRAIRLLAGIHKMQKSLTHMLRDRMDACDEEHAAGEDHGLKCPQCGHGLKLSGGAFKCVNPGCSLRNAGVQGAQ